MWQSRCLILIIIRGAGGYAVLQISLSFRRAEKEERPDHCKAGKKKFQMDIYLITLSCNGNNQLEIWNSVLFLQPSFPQTEHFVVGITKGYEEALELVEQITKEVYNETKGADIRSYILNKEQEK